MRLCGASRRIMSAPGRLHHLRGRMTRPLMIEADNGQQKRLLHFDSNESQGGDWQGNSKAMWEIVPAGRGEAQVGSLRVITTELRPEGYIRKNRGSL